MATIDDVAMQLTAHERIMQDRYEHLEHGLKKVKSALREEEAEMSDVRIDTNPMSGVLPMLMNQGGGTGAALGGGLGAGLLGGVLGGVMLNRNGVLGVGGGDAGGGFVTSAQLQTAVNTVTNDNDTTAILQTLGDIKASVPLAEAQTQLAIQNAQSDLNRNIDNTGDQITAQVSAAQLANANNFAATSRQLSEIIATSLASQNVINSNVLTQGAAGVAATKDAAYATQAAINNSTKEILAALNDQNIANLQRQLVVAESALADQRFAQRSRDVEVNVTQSVTQNQNQLNMQQQQQAQFQVLAQLAANVNNLANDIQAVRQTQSNVNFGVQGNAAQTASAANNRVN